VCRNATIDWGEKEQVRARMRAAIRRLLIRNGNPPDKQPTAIELIMRQAELLAEAA
jgi:type I restriction enzyme R subunit